MITHLTGISAPVHTHDTVETGTVLPGFGKLKPIPAPVHTRDTLSRVYPYPCHALVRIKVARMLSYAITYSELCGSVDEGNEEHDSGDEDEDRWNLSRSWYKI